MSATSERQVLVVRLPEKGNDNAREIRDYIIECLQLGVMVVGQGLTYKLEELPDLGGVKVFGGPGNEDGFLLKGSFERVESLPAEEPPEQPGDPPPRPARKRRSEAEIAEAERLEKRRIMDRFRNYRKTGGLGCFNPLAQRCGISASELRDLHNGVTVADLKTLKKIDKGLDKMDFEVAADG